MSFATSTPPITSSSPLTNTPPITMEQLLASDNHGRFELINGKLEEVNVSIESSRIGMRLAHLLMAFIYARQLGELLGADGYYKCFGEGGRNGRKPDVSFVLKERLPADLATLGYFTIPPDLAVEVISPHDTVYKLDQKIREYLDGGVRLLWVVDPSVREVMIHRIDGSTQRLLENDTLSGEDILPGFTCVVQEFLPAK